jgi:YHS domain-containing protein
MLMYLLSRVLFLLAGLWLLRLLWRLLTAARIPRQPGRAAKPRPVAGELMQDPQCGTYVSTAISVKGRRGDQELHFCSEKCREEFLRAPKTASR